MKYLCLALILLFSINCKCQEKSAPQDGVYFTKLRPIDNAVLKNDFKLFTTLFRLEYCDKSKTIDTSSKISKMQYLNDFYFYAVALSFENKRDSAFYYIRKIIANKDFDNYDGILGDIGFVNLKKDSRWNEIDAFARKKLMEEAKAYSQPELRVRLLALNMADQSNMLYDKDTFSTKRIAKALVDSVANILRDFGYPMISNVGGGAAVVPALILAHADITTQLKYKDLIYSEGIKGNIPGGMAGVMLDKIQVKEKGSQTYGSQYKILNKEEGKVLFYPIVDSANLEERRNKIGFTESYKDYKSMVENQFKRN